MVSNTSVTCIYVSTLQQKATQVVQLSVSLASEKLLEVIAGLFIAFGSDRGAGDKVDPTWHKKKKQPIEYFAYHARGGEGFGGRTFNCRGVLIAELHALQGYGGH